MSFLKNIFGANKDDKIKKLINEDFTPEQFFRSKYIVDLIEKYKRETIILRPRKSNSPIAKTESKFGGTPNFGGFENYPSCTFCSSPLNFVLQLYKEDFPTHYFPNNFNLFQLFRCPNDNCPDGYNEYYDHKMCHFYFDVSKEDEKEFLKQKINLPNFEDEIPDCYLKPEIHDDYPNYDDFEDDDFVNIERKFNSDLSELFMDKYSAINNSKIGGYPSYTQSPNYPICTCGKTKEFFFQLASEDIEEGLSFPPPSNRWSGHGIMIGDVGNIYYYVCKSCGPQTIESNWDCY